ncbi:MAG: hypothetical protein WCT04_03105 [Planctomycetota bacterium]
MKANSIMLAVVVMALMGGCGLVFGAESQTKTGTVKKIDATAKQITVLVARELTFTATDTTKITIGDKEIKLADIEIGATVTVDYVKDGEARNASKIVVTKKDEKKEEPKKDGDRK